MSEILYPGRSFRMLSTVTLLLFASTGTSQAQEIHVLAEPNQSIQMPRGGYVCEGRLTYTPAENGVDLETVQCTGRIYNAGDYAALQAKLNHDEMVKLNDTVTRTSQEALDRQAQQLVHDLKANIEERFQTLPENVLASEEVQNLKKSLLDYVDQRVHLEAVPFGAHLRRTPRSSGEPSSAKQP